VALGACDSDDTTAKVPTQPTTTGSGGSGTGGEGSGNGICLLNNCQEDAHCEGCADGRTTCLVAENRCVACDPTKPKGQQGCKDGEECSPFGLCVPEGITCPTDNDGNPTVVCTKNKDCQACSPMHQVCDTNTGKCQACTDTNTQHCLASDICLDGKCSPKCPQSCDSDNDCSKCGGPGNEAHACFNHKCAECSDTWPCAAGMECTQGVCTPPCGLPGPVAGTCTAEEDCKFCGDPNETWKCKTPVNDPTHGNCVPPANGCSDLGSNVVVLPPPYDQYTQSCSNDEDCLQAKAGIQYNVGLALRDLIGSEEIDLGFYKIKIQDANVEYKMPICASVEIADKKCGICVPCKEDADCDPINVDNLLLDLFKGDPLATIAGAVLVDLLWGKNKDHNLNFWCQPVAAGYGACLPCGNPLAPCGKNSGGGSGGSCDHDVCTEGTALKADCGDCAAKVCAQDSFCCDGQNGKWDKLCKDQADQLCGNICSGGNACAHDPCTIGDALLESCNACVKSVCTADPFCCNQQNGSWDNLCKTAAEDTNTHPDCANACGGCIHDVCTTGPKLKADCSPCATEICKGDSFCCDTEWDKLCVDAAKANATECASCT